MWVELLYVDGCPHGAAYLPHLQQLLAAAGADLPVRTLMIGNDDHARRERFLGSPTVRIGGRDVDPAATERADYGLSCRLYVTSDGLRGTPPDEWILAALPAGQR